MKKDPALFTTLQKVSMDKGRSKFFLVFLLLSFILWFIAKFSKQYTEVVSFEMEFENAPSTIVPMVQNLSKVEFTLKATGFQFLYYQLVDNRLTVDLQVAEFQQGRAILPIAAQYQKLKEQLIGTTEIINYFPAVIEFDYQEQASKRIAILPPKLKLALGYVVTQIQFEPDSIDLIGPRENIHKINSVEPLYNSVDPIQSSFERTLPLPNNDSFISLSHTNILMKVEVERFSEEKYQLPIEMINLPQGQVCKFFPSKATLTFSAPLNSLREITPEDFTIGFDYSQLKENARSLKIKLLKGPQGVTNVRLEPKEVQFLMRQ